jgi:hypothetical protein
MAPPRASPPWDFLRPLKEKTSLPRGGAKSLPGQGNLSRVVLAPRHPAVRGVEAPLADNRPREHQGVNFGEPDFDRPSLNEHSGSVAVRHAYDLANELNRSSGAPDPGPRAISQTAFEAWGRP